MSFKSTVLSVLIFISSILTAQKQEVYLVSINLTDDQVKEQVSGMNLNIFHQFDDKLLTIINDEQRKELEEPGISYELIDEVAEGDRYYLTGIKSESFQINEGLKSSSVFNSGGEYLVKNVNPESIQNDRLQLTELRLTPNLYKKKNISVNFSTSANIDSIITNLTEDVNTDSITYFIQSLQDFGTRYLYSENRKEVSLWIMNEFLRFGIEDVKLDSFVYNSTWQYNVVATIPSAVNSKQVIVIGGHHDSISGNFSETDAPGADDNASGTTAVLELARVLMLNNYKPEANIKFMTFAAEERGLHGSYYYAQKARVNGEEIKLMINHDMISYSPYNANYSTVDINYYGGSDEYSLMAYENVKSFTNLNVSYGSMNSGGSDSYSFWQNGFKAVYFEEHDFTPYYHTPSDVITNNNMGFCTEVIKASCATLITSMLVPASVKEINVVDVGDGSSLYLEWDVSSEPDFKNYNIYIGKSSGNYSRKEEASGNNIILDNLEEGVKYYLAVTIQDYDGFESVLVEKTFTPMSVPRPPQNPATKAQYFALKVNWDANLEMDVLGYNIYRSENAAYGFEKLNDDVINETEFIDQSPVLRKYNYYIITCVDSSLNESEKSGYVKAMPITLDNGILVVDETVDGNGELMKPTDEEVDEFFTDALSDFSKNDLNAASTSSLSINDLGAYSTIVWHYNVNSGLSTLAKIKEDIKTFLDGGGNLLFTGYNPSTLFDMNSMHPNQFEPGDFMYDYLKVSSVDKAFGSKFIGGKSELPGYPDLYVDTLKTKASSNYHLSNIEVLTPADDASTIYSFDTWFETSSYQGKLKNSPVGIEYLGEDYNIVLLSFPLYYMDKSAAKEFMQTVLSEKFGEDMVVSVEQEKELPQKFILSQNYPNPFNPSTEISYSVPHEDHVKLVVYNMLGQQVAELVNELKAPGSYNITINAGSENGIISSGVYFYKLSTGKQSITRKMVLIK